MFNLHNQHCINIINSISDFCCNSKGPVRSEICATILGDLFKFCAHTFLSIIAEVKGVITWRVFSLD